MFLFFMVSISKYLEPLAWVTPLILELISFRFL